MNNRSTILSILSLFVLIGLLWSQIGLHRATTLYEGWAGIDVVMSGDQLVPAKEPWVTRPLRWVPHAAAFYIDTGSHRGYTIVLITLFVIRALAVFVGIRMLVPERPQIALGTAALWLVYPVGEGFFEFRALTTQAALVAAITAISLLLVYWRYSKVWLWLVIWPVQLFAMLVHENVFSILGLAPALLLFIGGWQNRRRFFRVAVKWYFFYIFVALRTIYLFASGASGYVNSRAEDRFEEFSISQIIFGTTSEMYLSHLKAWYYTLLQTDFRSETFFISLIAAVVIAAVSLVSINDSPRRSNRYWISGVTAGIVAMLAFFVLYMPIATRAGSFRVYFGASLGASFVLIFAIHWLADFLPLRRYFIAGITGLLILFGTYDGLLQNLNTAFLSQRVQLFLSNVIETVPQDNEAVIVVVDEARLYQGQIRPFFRSAHFQRGLTYVYNAERSVYVCLPVKARKEYCQFDSQTVTYTGEYGEGETARLAYEDIVMFRTLPDGKLEVLTQIPYVDVATGYNPERFFTPAELPERVQTFFPCFPMEQCAVFDTFYFRRQ